MKKILALALTLIMVISCFTIGVSAEVVDYNNYEGFVYTKADAVDGTVQISDYTGSKKKVTVPSEIDGLKVTEVYGLKKAKTLKKITIPATVNYLRLSQAPALKNAVIDENSTYFSVENKLVLNKKGTTLKTCPGGLINVVIPDTVTKIYHQAFSGANIKTVEFGEKVEKVSTYAFSNCKRLSKIVIKNDEKAPKFGTMAFEATENVDFYVENNTVAKQLKKNLKKSKRITGADIYVGDKLVYENITVDKL